MGEQEILQWRDVAIAVVSALATVAVVAVQAYYRIRGEIKRFKELRNTHGTKTALCSTRLSEKDVTKRKL